MEHDKHGMGIQEVAALTGLTKRALRWYEQAGLVVPDREPGSDYRRYRSGHLKQLQQIVFLRELEFPLERIREILHDKRFNRLEALERQAMLLKSKRSKMDEMIGTLELAIAEEKGEYEMKDTERFKGFDFSHNPYEQEARRRWGDKAVEQSTNRLNGMSDGQKADFAEQMKETMTELADLRTTDAASQEAQQAIGRWYTLLNTMGTYTPQMFANLGRMYVDDSRFTASLDAYGAGLARFMRDAMIEFARRKAE